jgi:Kef-type K+ transport system membrane component KefB
MAAFVNQAGAAIFGVLVRADPPGLGGLFEGGTDNQPPGSISLGANSRYFLVIVGCSALAALIVAVVSPRLALPVVALELLLGILVGPQVLGLTRADPFIEFFANLGLGMLFFFAGYEIDFKRIAGSPLRLGLLGWLASLALAYSIGGLLVLAGVILSLLYVGSAIATTAIGTLIPILSDAGETKTRFGTFLLAAGAVGEFGPILLITLVLSTQNELSSALILILFVLLAVLAALVAVRSVRLGWDAFERTLETSGQLAVRLSVVITFALVALAASLGLDLLLGGFVAGLIARVALSGREVPVLESKLVAVGYGFFIPFFFVVSGVKFDLDALFASAGTVLKLPLFLGLFLVVRGVPAMLLYKSAMDLRDRAALAFLSATELPLVVAITTLAVADGHMRHSTAAALVGAAVVSTLIYPLVGLRLRGSRAAVEREHAVAPEMAVA